MTWDLMLLLWDQIKCGVFHTYTQTFKPIFRFYYKQKY